jgi:hypothetical protein
MTKLDHTLGLETVYYSAPVPRDLAVLNVLGIVFDKVHLPGTYLPFEGHDPEGVRAEIARLQDLPGRQRQSTYDLIGALKFMLVAGPVREMLVMAPDAGTAFNDDVPAELQDELYRAFHGPYPETWHPMFEGPHIKGLAGDVEMVTRQSYTYWGGALRYSASTGVPLLNDMPGFPMLQAADVPQDADGIAALLAIHSVLTTLPDLPMLTPEALAEFRVENQAELRAFRATMLRYAGKIGKDIKGVTPEDLQQELNFFIKTEIVPTLDELRRTFDQPARPWFKRAVDLARISAQLGVGLIAGKEGGPALAAVSAFAPQLFTEIMAKGDKHELLQRGGLTYLLKLRQAVGG